ncbi:MAG: proton-conducting transporter membrane subunit [Gammaproteobacteria bacterium]
MPEWAAAPAAWLILIPLLWATLAFLFGPRWGGRFALFGITVQSLCAMQLVAALDSGVTQVLPVGGWSAPLGIELHVDGLAALMLLLTQVVALPLMLYTRAWLGAADRAAGYVWPLCGFMLAALHALFLAADLFNVYVALELLGLCAVALVAGDGKPQQLRAALHYLLVSLLAAAAYLLGVALFYAAYGTVSIATLVAVMDAQPPFAVVLAGTLMLVGLMAKTALFPFHFWLPPAHGSAPAPASALLSALVVKASFYVILRLRLTVFAEGDLTLDWLLAGCGGAAILYGSWRAFRCAELKMLIAYSTVAQLGYLFLIFPLLDTRELALAAAALQMVAHALAKAALFAAAGIVLVATGRDSVAALAALAGRLPVTWFAFGLAAVTLMGLPPSGGFLAKWLLIDAAVAGEYWLMVGLIISGGLLGAAYLFRILKRAFAPQASAAVLKPVPRIMEWMAFLLAAASVVIGIEATAIVEILGLVGST